MTVKTVISFLPCGQYRAPMGFQFEISVLQTVIAQLCLMAIAKFQKPELAQSLETKRFSGSKTFPAHKFSTPRFT